MKKIRLFVIGLVAMAISACTTIDGTVNQKFFEAVSNYEAVIGTVDIYVNSPTADPNIKTRLKTADAKAYPAVEVMKTVAIGQTPEFCGKAIPEDVGLALAAAACSQDLPAVARQTWLLVNLLIAVLQETTP